MTMRYLKKDIKRIRFGRRLLLVWQIFLVFCAVGLIGFSVYRIHKFMSEEDKQYAPRISQGPDYAKILAEIDAQVVPGSDLKSLIKRTENVRKATRGKYDEAAGAIYEKILWTATDPVTQNEAYTFFRDAYASQGQYKKLMETFERISASGSHVAIIIEQYLQMVDAYIAKGDDGRAKIYIEKIRKKLDGSAAPNVKAQYKPALESRLARLK